MGYLLFIDESGHDRREAPYEVLAGVVVHDRDLWGLITALREAEIRHFGRRYSQGTAEIKGSKVLKTKVFHHARLNAEVADEERVSLAKAALDDGSSANVRHLRALALAKLAYVHDALEICRRFGCRAFASIVETDSEATGSDGLRKDYAYLFERFFYFLEDTALDEPGLLVFDELEKSQSHLLMDQAERYFRETATGKARARRIIPEPFFVHSELTTGIQLADLVAYIISWGFRTSAMTKPARPELADFAQQVADLRYKAIRPKSGKDYEIWSFAHITDLRTRREREGRK